ncbi:hypothetical protein E3N88_38249 [Mikania micrantha]|uniref:Uncharacterized protein n=1 Tax=Mikania micrantha TaxID=192012 RepID=A0A5N6LVZ5_9ASTR|nr:hypothetical protein E3N88_38249 [Mikania micrantha]
MGDKVSNSSGVISFDENTLTSSFIVRTDSMSCNELVDIVCSHVLIDRATVNVNLVLYYTFQGVPLTSNLFGDEGVNMLYYLDASQISFIGDIFVTWDPKIAIQPTSMMDLLRGFSASQSYVGEMGSPIHVDNQLIFQQPGDEEQEDADEELKDVDEEIQDQDDTQEDGDTEDSEVPPSDSESEDDTTQKRKYILVIRELRSINEEAWKYLLNIEKRKWTLLFDSGRRRWGTLTTNIFKSLNNVLRDARLLPIKACIDFTFQKVVSQYVNDAEITNNCNNALPSHMWSVLIIVTGVHKIMKFSCMIALKRVVCRQRDGLAHEIVDVRFYTYTYRQQYDGHYYSLRHKALWPDAGWIIQGDPSKVTTLREGHRILKRIRNEMVVHYANEPRNYKCGICMEQGHRMTNCPYANN